MGAINYKSSDYITLGIKPYDYVDFENDAELMEEIKAEVTEYGGIVEEAIYNYINLCYEADYTNVEAELKKYDFYYFHIAIEPGYYEGFTLDIQSNFPVAYDGYEDKKEAQKEITTIKQLLIDCAGLGLVACFPGWSTGYDDYAGTIERIKKAIREMREEAKNTPTWLQYEKAV